MSSPKRTSRSALGWLPGPMRFSAETEPAVLLKKIASGGEGAASDDPVIVPVLGDTEAAPADAGSVVLPVAA